MILYAFRGEAPNFGDELNHWLLPKLLPGFFDDDAGKLFLGIGSILFDYHPAEPLKIVFGSGCGGYTAAPKLDHRWQVHFVRGPRTAQILGLDPAAGIGDSAVLLRALGLQRAVAPRGPIFIPHVTSAIYGEWAPAAAAAGLRYVDPRRPVDEILEEILAATVVVSEAMHGVIVADALRVPWVAMRPLFRNNIPKWADWGDSLGLGIAFRPMPPSGPVEAALIALQRHSRASRALRWHGRRFTGIGAPLLRGPVVRALQHAAAATPQLSEDQAIGRAFDQMQEKLRLVQRLHAPAELVAH